MLLSLTSFKLAILALICFDISLLGITWAIISTSPVHTLDQAQCLKERVLNGLGLRGNHDFVAFFPQFRSIYSYPILVQKNGQMSNTLNQRFYFILNWLRF